MILVHSDVFLIDLRYQRDERFGGNRAFLDRLAISGQGATTIYKEVTTFVTWNALHFRGRTCCVARPGPRLVAG